MLAYLSPIFEKLSLFLIFENTNLPQAQLK